MDREGPCGISGVILSQEMEPALPLELRQSHAGNDVYSRLVNGQQMLIVFDVRRNIL